MLSDAELLALCGPPPEAPAAAVHLACIPTPLGPMLAGALPEAVCLLAFVDAAPLGPRLRALGRGLGCAFAPGRTETVRRLEAELEAYFAGALRRFETPVEAVGTPFQRQAWQALREIPYGATRSYGAQAAALGAPAAVRAVAAANAANPVCLLAPCHRVIGAGGRLTGYAGGLWRKERLLALEGALGQAAPAL